MVMWKHHELPPLHKSEIPPFLSGNHLWRSLHWAPTGTKPWCWWWKMSRRRILQPVGCFFEWMCWSCMFIMMQMFIINWFSINMFIQWMMMGQWWEIWICSPFWGVRHLSFLRWWTCPNSSLDDVIHNLSSQFEQLHVWALLHLN